MPEPTRCTVLRTPEELFALDPPWRRLWQSDPFATPFQSPEWLLPWWRHFGEGTVRSVALHRRGSLIGLLPFYVYTEPGDGQRKLLPIGISTSDYLDGIFAPDCAAEDIVSALDALTAEGGYDSFECPQLRPESRLGDALRLWRPDAFQPSSGESTTQRAAVPHAELPAKIRRNTRYYSARAALLGTLKFSPVSAQDSLAAYDALERLHTARWQHSGEPGVFADPRVSAWHRDAIPQLAAQGIARLFSLSLDGEDIALLYTLADPESRNRRTLYCYLPAYSVAHDDLCPGTLLLAYVIDHAAQQGFQVADFLRGDERYKDLWHTIRVPTGRLCFEPQYVTGFDPAQRATAAA